MAGSIINPKRPRYQANERFDVVDADVQSRAPREQDKSSMRAVHSEPRNTAGTPSTIGMIFTGFELTLNPTSGNDGKVRVGSNLGVALDADGGVLIKPQGTTNDITIPVGTYQLYAYYSEISTDNAKRQFLSVTSPFGESPNSIDTTFQGQCQFVAIAGNAASVVPEAVVNGVTTPLCCIGIVTNGGTGAITCTGYNAVTAPNGTDIVGRLAVPELTSSAPLTPYVNGSIKSITGMLKHLAYVVGQLAWKGSKTAAPALTNNFGAYSLPTAGIDALFDSSTENTTTPITSWRDWNVKRRSIIDHNGYRMGQVTEVDERWNVPATRTWCYTMVANQRVTGSGGGWTFTTPFVGAIVINANGQAFSVLLAPQTNASFTIVSATANINRTNGTDQVAVGLVATSSVASTAVPTSIHGVTFTQGTSSSGTGDTVLDLGIVGGLTGGVVDYFVGNNTAIMGSVSAVGTPTGTNSVSHISMVVVVDPRGWVYAPDIVTLASGLPAPIVKRSFEGPSSTINQASFKLITAVMTAPAAGVGRMLTEQYECFLNADVAYVQEWMMRTGTIAGGANIRTFALGIQNSNGGSEDRFVYFFNQNTTANWQLRVVGSSTLDTDTGVAIAANTTYRMRLEIAGANVSTAGGTSFRIRGYINGVKVVDIVSSTLPIADMIRPYFHAGCTAAGATAAYGFNVGRVRRAWNHVLDGDNL